MALTAGSAAPSMRVISVDVMRGLTILAMIFVNDIAGVAGTPAWLLHFQPSDGNGMTVVDVVFPAFLFIVGLAIPLALRSRQQKGETTAATVRHVLTRSLSLLIIGVMMVNADVVSPTGLVNPDLWTLLAYAGVFLVWVRWPARSARDERIQHALQLVGLTVLIVSALTYRADGGSGLIQLRPHWWGILGLIGWAYLVACLTFIAVRGNPWLVVGSSACLFALSIALESGWLGLPQQVPLIGSIGTVLGSHAALVLLGAAMGRMFLPDAAPASWAAGGILAAAGFAVTGWLLYLPHERIPYLIVNKNAGTPPWCLFSAAITAACLVVVSLLVDRRAPRRWSALPELAGKNALLAYILAPVIYALFGWLAGLTATPNLLHQLGSPFALGLGRSIAMALLVTGIAAWLGRRRITLKI